MNPALGIMLTEVNINTKFDYIVTSASHHMHSLMVTCTHLPCSTVTVMIFHNSD